MESSIRICRSCLRRSALALCRHDRGRRVDARRVSGSHNSGPVTLFVAWQRLPRRARAACHRALTSAGACGSEPRTGHRVSVSNRAKISTISLSHLKLRAEPVSATSVSSFESTPISVPLYTPLVGPLAFAYHRVSPWALPLFLVPGLAAQRLWAHVPGSERTRSGSGLGQRQLERANLSFATAWSRPWMRETATRLVTRPRSRSTRETSHRVGLRRTAGARPPLRSGPRHREGRRAAGISRNLGR